MKILMIGDIVGGPGRRITRQALPRVFAEHDIDYCVANAENAAGGFGVTRDVFRSIDELPIDCYTSGNHIWDKREVEELLAEEPRLLRPANYSPGPEGARTPGGRYYLGATAAGVPVAVFNLEGRVFMKDVDSPFLVADELLAEIVGQAKIIVVDVHAETTSEKQAMGFYLDGRVSAVLGTHTHVPTADERILPEGTAFQTDVGMTGPYESVIGMRHDKVLERFLTQRPRPFEVAKRDVRLAAAVVEVDEKSGKARSIERVLVAE